MKYEPVIGLEIHCQINTMTKMFCRCSNDSFNMPPNTNVCPICMGFPGQLPILNDAVVNKAIIAGLSLKCKIPEFSKFDRKNYFYPDLPKGFQISQYDKPIAVDGEVTIRTDNGEKTIGIERLHMEDDAGKLTHTEAGTLCDYNRSGTPLVEIVSRPDLRSVEEASTYAREIQRIMRYCNASDADMEKGMMRFDINVSIRPKGTDQLGIKTEIKNLNSFHSLKKAIDYEINRQIKKLENHLVIVQETRGWDDKNQKTFSQREKEEAHDYRYFPEPDLPPIITEEDTINKLKKQVPELPAEKFKKFTQKFKLDPDDAALLTETSKMAEFFEKAHKTGGNPQLTSAFITTILLKFLNAEGLTLSDSKITPQHIGELVQLVESGEISNNIAKSTVFEEMYDTGKMPSDIVKEKGLKQVSDSGQIEQFCREAIEENPGAAKDVKQGKEKAIGALVGVVMQKSGGQANPKLVNEKLRELLS